MIRSGNRFRIRPVKKVAIDATATLTASQLGKGVITTTSAAATSLTLPVAVDIVNHLKAQRGDQYEFVVDNSVGANIVTVVINTGITLLGTVVITGSSTLTVAVASVGIFKLYFTSATTAKLIRTS